MRYLVLSSLLLLIFSCTQSPYRHLQPAPENTSCLVKFKPDFSSLLYTTHVDVVGKHLSGLLLFKKMPDTSIRVTFLSEMGAKFFDFEYAGSGFKVIYCMEQFNRKAVIGQLKKVIGLMIMDGVSATAAKPLRNQNELYYKFQSGKESTYYITDADCRHLLRIEQATEKHKKIIVYLTDYNNGMADSVNISHQSFEFKINLKQLIR